MKPLKNFLLILPLFFFYPKTSKVISREINKTINEHYAPPNDFVTAVSLVYGGNIKKTLVGIQIYMDTSIGIRYEVTFEDGNDDVLSHMAIFYKFSNPYQSVYYNFLTHKSEILTTGGSTNDGDPNLKVIGTETIDTFLCTHLVNKSGNSTKEFWMSEMVPGFGTFVQKLNKVDPNLIKMGINQYIFNWGGLVKLKDFYKDDEVANIDLQVASPNILLPAADFDPPK